MTNLSSNYVILTIPREGGESVHKPSQADKWIPRTSRIMTDKTMQVREMKNAEKI
jgi:hypothetical protein